MTPRRPARTGPPLIALVIVLTVFFSLRSINKRYPDKKPQAEPPAATGSKRKKGKKNSRT